MEAISPSSSSRMLTDCLHKSESCLRMEHRLKPHTSAKSVNDTPPLLNALLHTSLGAMMRLQNGILFSFILFTVAVCWRSDQRALFPRGTLWLAREYSAGIFFALQLIVHCAEL